MVFRKKSKKNKVEKPIEEKQESEETKLEIPEINTSSDEFNTSSFTTLAVGGDGRLDVFNPSSEAWRGRMTDEGLI